MPIPSSVLSAYSVVKIDRWVGSVIIGLQLFSCRSFARVRYASLNQAGTGLESITALPCSNTATLRKGCRRSLLSKI